MVPCEYIVNHGRAAFLGRFINRSGEAFTHGDRVVIGTARGIETGSILSESAAHLAHLVGATAAGEIIRRMSADDVDREMHLAAESRKHIAIAQDLADEQSLPVTILDGEMLFEGDQVILQVLPFADCDLTPLAETISARHSILCTFHDLRQVPVKEEPEGCGKPGCGSTGDGGGCTSCSTGGGCSTGSCSKGAVKSAGDLSAYFTDLREKMEEHVGRVPLHG